MTAMYLSALAVGLIGMSLNPWGFPWFFLYLLRRP